MSNNTNTILYERAAELIDYFEGKLPAQLIEKDLENNDLDSLYEHVTQAEGLRSQEEFQANDCI